jgi:two-component system sensor histidine kinase KdpD
MSGPDEAAEPTTLPQKPSVLLGYLWAMLMTAAATVAAVLMDHAAPVPNVSLVFVLPVVIAAVSFGWGPALVAALAGALSYNFFLIEPKYTLRIDDPANVWAVVLLLITAALVSALGAQARRKTLEAVEHADQATVLQALAKALVAAPDQAAILAATTEALDHIFKAPAVILTAHNGDLTVAAGEAELTPADLDAARWAMGSRLATWADAYPTYESAFDFWPLVTPSRHEAVIGVRFPLNHKSRPYDRQRLVDIVAGYLAVALDRAHFARQAVETRLAIESERMKSDLLAAVSHDLRTPLSTILVTLQSLQRFGDSHDAATRAELLGLAAAETARLSGLVANLLDMSRIDADAVAVKTTSVLPTELVASAIARARSGLAGRRVINRVGPEAPAVMIDYSLAETALANVLENAGKYSEPGCAVEVRLAQTGANAVIEVLDEGPGFPKDSSGLFEKFTRGVEGDGRPPGTGLGLAIARGFLEVQGGRIEARNRTDRQGGRVTLILPMAEAGVADVG